MGSFARQRLVPLIRERHPDPASGNAQPRRLDAAHRAGGLSASGRNSCVLARGRTWHGMLVRIRRLARGNGVKITPARALARRQGGQVQDAVLIGNGCSAGQANNQWAETGDIKQNLNGYLSAWICNMTPRTRPDIGMFGRNPIGQIWTTLRIECNLIR